MTAFVCSREHQPVSTEEGQAFIEAYYGLASGSTPRKALEMHADPARPPSERFEREWETSVYAEVVGTVKSLSS